MIGVAVWVGSKFDFTRQSLFRVALGLLLVVVFGWAAFGAAEFVGDARSFPLGVSLIGLVVALIVCGSEVWKARRSSINGQDVQRTPSSSGGIMDLQDDSISFRAMAQVFGFISLFVLLIVLFGTYVAMAVSVSAYLYLRTSMRWYSFSIAVILPVAFLYALESFAGLQWPSSMVFFS